MSGKEWSSSAATSTLSKENKAHARLLLAPGRIEFAKETRMYTVRWVVRQAAPLPGAPTVPAFKRKAVAANRL